MDIELWQKLEQKFPFMRRDKANDGSNTYQNWGFECGTGWYDLLHDLCQAITERYERDGIPVDIVVQQVKEKYGTLRFYYWFDGSATVAVDVSGKNSIRFPTGEEEDDKRAVLRRDIADIVALYEDKSETVCEKCGSEGSLREELPWRRVLCDECYQKGMQALKK